MRLALQRRRQSRTRQGAFSEPRGIGNTWVAMQTLFGFATAQTQMRSK